MWNKMPSMDLCPFWCVTKFTTCFWHVLFIIKIILYELICLGYHTGKFTFYVIQLSMVIQIILEFIKKKKLFHDYQITINNKKIYLQRSSPAWLTLTGIIGQTIYTSRIIFTVILQALVNVFWAIISSKSSHTFACVWFSRICTSRKQYFS